MRERLRDAARSAAVKHLTAGIIFVASRKWTEGEWDGDAATGKEKRNRLQSVGSSAIILSVPNRR